MSQSTIRRNLASYSHDKVLVFSLISIVGVIVFINIRKDFATAVGDLLYVPVTSFFVATSIILTIRTKEKRLKRFLIFYSLAAVSWFTAFQTWAILELAYHETPFPSIADIFFILGPLCLLAALVCIFLPNSKKISTDAKIIGTVVSIFLLVPPIILTDTVPEADNLARILSFTYPVLDSALLWFATVFLIGFKSKRNQVINYVTLGIVFFTIADTHFTISSINETYYVGNPFEIFWYWGLIFFGLVAYRGIKSPDICNCVFEKTEEDVRKLELSSKYRLFLISSLSVVSMLLTVAALNVFKITFLSSNEERLITPVLYASLSFIIILTILNFVFAKKRSSLELKSKKILTGKITAAPTEIALIEKQIQLIEARTKRNSKITLLGIASLVAILLTFVSLTEMIGAPERGHLSSGRYLIENLKGDKINTWVTWHIPKEEILEVTIINSPGLSDERINIIKDAITSEETLVLENSFLNKDPPNEKSTYYKGWKGALESIGNQKTKLAPPSNFDVTTSEKSVGDIIIILSTAKEADNTYGFTRSIADESAGQILKSFITIFDVDNLDEVALSAVVRHEFGHAMGLAHSTDSEDLMYPNFHSTHAFISECDLDAIISLYNDEKSTEITCRH
ncbi:MAG: matrixin family metalloprotease [Thaumarchaeota archaeon]|nr:matrixin family metalloprotease [Nitrososphaerota archaeon]